MIEDGAKVAAGFMEAMRAQPLALALVVVNLMFLIGGAYILGDAARAVRSREARATEQIDKLISECLVPRSTMGALAAPDRYQPDEL